jgi:hypothetical protein
MLVLSLHRSRIFREFVSDAGSGSGILRLRTCLAETLSRRDFMKVARHEMPGTRYVNARPGGYGVIGNPTHIGLY